MMTDRFKTLLVSLAAALSFTACATVQVELQVPSTTAVDPTAPDAVVEYGGPDPLVIETENGPVTFTVELAESQAARTRGMVRRHPCQRQVRNHHRRSRGPRPARLPNQ